jgi:hypothetical protein
VITGRIIKLARLKDEDFQADGPLANPQLYIERLRDSNRARVDLFTFAESLTDPTPYLPYKHVFESVAAVRIISYEDWWANCVSSDLRCDVRKARKRGLEVRSITFGPALIRGISEIYNELPVRHGRIFWHYGKGLAEVELENRTYLDRSEFVGAFLGEELVGFLKMVYVGQYARLMQIIAKSAHRDKRPMNALLAKAVELCAGRGCSHLTYGRYRYCEQADSLSAFKKRNGFEEILVPRYFVPLSGLGTIALRLMWHRGWRTLVPERVQAALKKLRCRLYEMKYSKS